MQLVVSRFSVYIIIIGIGVRVCDKLYSTHTVYAHNIQHTYVYVRIQLTYIYSIHTYTAYIST